MITFRRRFVGPVLAALSVECSPPTSPADALTLNVVAAARDASGIVRFGLELTNSGDRPLFVPRCGATPSARLQLHGATNWQEFGGGTCLANLDQSPFQVDASMTVRTTVTVCCGAPGEYRAVTSVAVDPSRGGELVQSSAVYLP